MPGSRAYLQDLWSLAYKRGVTLLLAGHVHKYERWTPMDPTGNPVAGGLTQIVAGGGGREAVNPSTPDPRVVARGGVGALRLDLGADDLAFTYADATGATVDQGTVACRQRVPVPSRRPRTRTPPPRAPTGRTGDADGSPRPLDAADLSWRPVQRRRRGRRLRPPAQRRRGRHAARQRHVVARRRARAGARPTGGPSRPSDAAGNRSAQSAPASATTPMPLRSTKQLLADLRTAPEHRAGWTSRRFPGWTDADGDRCRTPSEVFLAEALRPRRGSAPSC